MVCAFVSSSPIPGAARMRQDSLPPAWISSRRSSPEAVRRRLGPRALDLLDAMQPGDEIRSFRSPTQSWKSRRGRRGFVVLRGGKLVKVLLTAIN